jgi:hypothetical protein
MALEALLDQDEGPMAKWYGRRLALVSNALSLGTGVRQTDTTMRPDLRFAIVIIASNTNSRCVVRPTDEAELVLRSRHFKLLSRRVQLLLRD